MIKTAGSVSNKPAALWILLAFFLLMLLVSGVAKLLDPPRFQQVVNRLYGPLPKPLLLTASWALIAFELVAAAALLVKRFRVRAAYAIAGLMWLFVLVQLRILLFFPGLDCGCFGKLFQRKPGFRTFGETVLFFLLALWMVRLAKRQAGVLAPPTTAARDDLALAAGEAAT